MKPKSQFRFSNFKVFQDAKSFYHEIVMITAQFPRQYWELGDQMRRSALSVILNLAEGSAKKSDRDFNRYIKNSLGSINECAAGIDVAFGEKLINEAIFKNLMIKASEIANQLGGFSKALR